MCMRVYVCVCVCVCILCAYARLMKKTSVTGEERRSRLACGPKSNYVIGRGRRGISRVVRSNNIHGNRTNNNDDKDNNIPWDTMIYVKQ